MDSRGVGKALKAIVFPLLREGGFSEFKSRGAWRFRQHSIDVVAFRSLGSYLADSIGVTSHSFGADAGIYYRALHAVPWAEGPAPEFPEESYCHARRTLRKGIGQSGCRRPDIWYVEPDGSNIQEVIDDVRRAVRDEALPWLLEFGEPARALGAFESREDSEMAPGIIREDFGGGLNSFARAEAASALALACAEPARAQDAWRRVLANHYYQRVPDLFAEAKRRLELLQTGDRGDA